MFGWAAAVWRQEKTCQDGKFIAQVRGMLYEIIESTRLEEQKCLSELRPQLW
jgi:hypothetical protein